MDVCPLKQARNLIADRAGVQIREIDDTMLAKVVAERVQELHLAGIEQYCQLLSSDKGIRQEREALVIPLTAGETYFFRDSAQHALLQNRILPDLIERQKNERSLRIWSAACATGEETYSLAILLDELMPDQSHWNICLIGTDINRNAIEKARRGIYTEWSFRGISDERRQRYFHQAKTGWKIDDTISRRVRFQTGDLVADEFPEMSGEFHDMDLILCRNAFIYMPPLVVSRIANKFAETLTVGGILVTSHGELYAHHLGKLRARVYPESIVYQKVIAPYSSATPAPPAKAKRSVPQKKRIPTAAAKKTRTPVPPQQQAPDETGQEKSTSEMLQAWQYANEGQSEMAAKVCSAMIAKDPLYADPHYLMALLAQEHGDTTAAKELLKKVIYLDPSLIGAYLDLADLYSREGDGARAIKMRLTTWDLLKDRPGDEVVRLYGSSTVTDVLHYIEHLLNNNIE